MTREEFNTKYDAYIERREYVNREGTVIEQKFGGLEFDIPEVTEYLDRIFTGLINIDTEFTYSQIKLKFNRARFYSTLKSSVCYTIEEEIDKLVKVFDSK